MRKINIATAILTHHERILLLRRSPDSKSMPGLWSGVSGIIEGNECPRDRARTEILEETGIAGQDIAFLRSSKPVCISSDVHVDACWVVHPFLFESKTKMVRLNFENSEYAWASPGQIASYRTVPGLAGIVLGLL